jgi:invasion protein IalB
MIAAMLLAGLLLAATAAAEEGVTTYGDWGYKCEKAPNSDQELCFMFQNVTKKDGGELVLGARIAMREGQPNPLLVVTVPLGSLLPPGAALMMDGVDPVKLPFLLCAQQGCTTVATGLPPAMIEAMKKGAQASIRIAAPNQQVIPLPLSLTGFTKALASLQN